VQALGGRAEISGARDLREGLQVLQRECDLHARAGAGFDPIS
jgi:hypothetical protein